MSLCKKKRLERLESYHFDHVLNFLGEMSHCKSVSKKIVPENYTTSLKFKTDTPVTTMFAVLSRRKNIQKLDFTGSTSMNDSILHVVLMLHPNVKLIVLDRCDNFEDFPSSCCTDEINVIHLSTRCQVKWTFESSPTLSFRGCWRLFFPSHNQKPECITEIIMCALNDKSRYAFDKISLFCADIIDWFTRISGSSLVVALTNHTKWSIRHHENFGDKGYVLMDVEGYSLVVWIFTKRDYRGKSIWMMLGIWKVSIYRIWKLCKLFCRD